MRLTSSCLHPPIHRSNLDNLISAHFEVWRRGAIGRAIVNECIMLQQHRVIISAGCLILRQVIEGPATLNDDDHQRLLFGELQQETVGVASNAGVKNVFNEVILSISQQVALLG